jgi:hypothetical protein
LYWKGNHLKHIGAAIINQALSSIDSDEYDADGCTSHAPRQNPKKQRNNRHHRSNNSKPHPSEEYETIDIQLSGAPSTASFCSRSEAICAELLRQFVPHFRLEEGVTFQVPIGIDDRGNTLSVDFFVDGVLFEYHPARFFKNKKGYGDFGSKDEYKAYARLFHSVGKSEREFVSDAVRARLKDNYYKRRRALLDQHPLYRRTELVVATSPEEFYYLILCRFGRNIPKSVERFLMMFEELRETLP